MIRNHAARRYLSLPFCGPLMPSLLEPSRPPGIAALCAWFWSPVVGREWGILWLLPLRRPSHRTSTEQETNCCTGWCDSFVSCRRPKAAGPRAGLWRHGSKQAGAVPAPPTGEKDARRSESRHGDGKRPYETAGQHAQIEAMTGNAIEHRSVCRMSASGQTRLALMCNHARAGF